MDANAINGLMKALKLLQSSDGSMNVDQLWNECLPVPLQEDTQTSQAIGRPRTLLLKELKSSRRELKHLLDAITYLSSSLEKKIPPLNAIYEPLALSRFADTAPVEILDKIFENVCSSGSRQKALTLSKVNKRFHNIVTGNPRLWSRIDNVDNNDSYGELLVSLKRSKVVPLTVCLSFDNAKIDMSLRLLDKVAQEAPRWKYVFYRMVSVEAANWETIFRDISQYSTDLNLPCLKRAILAYPSATNLDEEKDTRIINHSEPHMHFYTTWFVPNLTRFQVFNLPPRPFSRPAVSLTILELAVNEGNTGTWIYDMSLLLEFLRSCPALKVLYLDFLSPKLSTIHDDQTLPETVLPNVQEFRITALTLDPRDLLPLMEALRLPDLRALTAQVGIGAEVAYTGLNMWLHSILPHSRTYYKHVVFFKLKTHMPPGRSAIVSWYDVPFEMLPNLRCLFLETPGFCPDMTVRAGTTLPKLKEVHFIKCGVVFPVLEMFATALRRHNRWDTFWKVTITDCKHLSDSEVMVKLAFKGKVVTWV